MLATFCPHKRAEKHTSKCIIGCTFLCHLAATARQRNKKGYSQHRVRTCILSWITLSYMLVTKGYCPLRTVNPLPRLHSRPDNALSPFGLLPVRRQAKALEAVGVDARELTEADEFFGTAALKSYNTFVRPRPKQLPKVSSQQTSFVFFFFFAGTFF